MKKLTALIALILFLTLAMVLPANRSSARQSEPALDQVLEKYVQAVGGKTAFDKLTSRVTLQDVTGGDATQTVEIYEKAPNKRLIMVSSGGSVQTLNGFDGAIASAPIDETGCESKIGCQCTPASIVFQIPPEAAPT